MPKGAGGREEYLCGALTGLTLPWFRAAKHLHFVAVGERRGGHGGSVPPEERGGRWRAVVGSPTGARGGVWRVGGQLWDGPLLQPRLG